MGRNSKRRPPTLTPVPVQRQAGTGPLFWCGWEVTPAKFVELEDSADAVRPLAESIEQWARLLVYGVGPEATEAERTLVRLSLFVTLRDVCEGNVGHLVEWAREQGAAWSDIGSALGVTRQAAQKRYAQTPGEEAL
jgi:hypothetical protein